MKITKLFVVAGMLPCLTVTAAQAIVFQPYYMSGGHTGTAVVRASGGCTIAATTFENAQMGYIYDSSDDSYVGWGIINAQGNILALENNFATINYVHDNATGKGRASYFEDFSSAATYSYIEDRAQCSISLLDSNSNASAVLKWDYMKGIDTALLKFGFAGYTNESCVTVGSVETCTGKKFSGSITFKGSAPVL